MHGWTGVLFVRNKGTVCLLWVVNQQYNTALTAGYLPLHQPRYESFFVCRRWKEKHSESDQWREKPVEWVLHLGSILGPSQQACREPCWKKREIAVLMKGGINSDCLGSPFSEPLPIEATKGIISYTGIMRTALIWTQNQKVQGRVDSLTWNCYFHPLVFSTPPTGLNVLMWRQIVHV